MDESTPIQPAVLNSETMTSEQMLRDIPEESRLLNTTPWSQRTPRITSCRRPEYYPAALKEEIQGILLPPLTLIAQVPQVAQTALDYDYKMEYIKGKENACTDIVSRKDDHEKPPIPNTEDLTAKIF
uniref:Uncharacterized protein n=1 Tax=Romanomermis culicivorax TaxID=13658 RepID=A0A915IJK5_ROMCU